MINYLWTFQVRVSGLNANALLAMAIIAFAAGLFVWIGGFGFRKILFALTGVFSSIAISILLSNSNLLMNIALAGICLLLAIKFEVSFLVICTSLFAAICGFSVLIRPYIDPSDELIAVVRQLTIGVPYYNWPILLFLIALAPAAKSSSWRVTHAILPSTIGACFILAGIIILMARSGVSAAGFISSKREVILVLFIAFIVLGAIMQLIILPKISSRFAAVKHTIKIKNKRSKKNKQDNSGPVSESKATAWRTA